MRILSSRRWDEVGAAPATHKTTATAVEPPRRATVAAPAVAAASAGVSVAQAVAPAAGVEKRASVRQTIVAKATLFLDPPAKVEGEWPVIEPTLRVYLTNLSMGGVGFRVPRVLEAGRTGRMRIEIGPIKFVSRLEVVRATLREDRVMEVGARFVRDEVGTGNTRPAMVNQPIMTAVPRNPCRVLAPKKRA